MSEVQLEKSVCGLCAGGCGVLVTLRDGKAVEVKGDPENPVNKGFLCKIGRALLEYLYHPERLKSPLKRIGNRGEGNWQPISWDEAFDSAGNALNRVKQTYGPEAVFMAHGSAKGYMDTHLVRLANAFGTPNVVCSDHVCHVPRMLAGEMTFGFFPFGKDMNPPACIMLWGYNPAETRSLAYGRILEAQKKGAKLVVIDPLKTGIAQLADIWLPVKPGSDLALALGMINIIISEGLYDEDFVKKWTVGFDRLKSHVKTYTPQKVEEITWIPADTLVQAARIYASSKSAQIESGNALDHNLHSFQSGRALCILMALTGNIGVPGGEFVARGSGFRFSDPWQPASGIHRRWSSELELRNNISKTERKKKVGAEWTEIPDFRYTTPQAITRSILKGEPYQIRAGYIQASNPLSSWSNIRETRAALECLDFFAVSDMFLTPTANLADIVFPVATSLEYDGIATSPIGGVAHLQRKIAEIGECRSDHEIVIGLAKRLGLEAFFWKSTEGFWDVVLEPSGLTFEEFKAVGLLTPGKPESRNYERQGFDTPSGKVELYSIQLERLGLDPIPNYKECTDATCGDLLLTEEYPLLVTTRKLGVYRHSGGRQIPSLRNAHPNPIVIIHPKTASKLGIGEGDWVFIENAQGKIRQIAHLSNNVDPRVIVADHAWWFPERAETDQFGWEESNYNVLTNNIPPFNRETGSFNIRGLACKLYKTT